MILLYKQVRLAVVPGIVDVTGLGNDRTLIMVWSVYQGCSLGLRQLVVISQFHLLAQFNLTSWNSCITPIVFLETGLSNITLYYILASHQVLPPNCTTLKQLQKVLPTCPYNIHHVSGRDSWIKPSLSWFLISLLATHFAYLKYTQSGVRNF